MYLLGNISQWGEVAKTKKPSKPKAKDASSATNNESTVASGSRTARGGRAAAESARGRGRATDRGGRGGSRGRVSQAAATPSARNKENQTPLSVPTEESPAWGEDKSPDTEPLEAKIAAQVAAELPTQPAAQAKTWASMVRQSTVVPKPVSKPQEPTAPALAETPETIAASQPAEPEPQTQPDAALEQEATPVAEPAAPATTVTPVVESEVALEPGHDELTRTNLEQVVDDSKPPATHTAASTAADSWDPRQSTPATPLSAAQQQHQAQRQTSSGFAASALKATGERASRTPTYQRRVLDQEEAVRMPGNREVDRTAVQFGAFNLGAGDEDIDGEREDAETRGQPPADSPISHPRTSLPPASQSSSVQETLQQKQTLPGQSSRSPPSSTNVPISANLFPQFPQLLDRLLDRQLQARCLRRLLVSLFIPFQIGR